MSDNKKAITALHRRLKAEALQRESDAWAKLTDDQRAVFSDLNFRASQFELQRYVPEPVKGQKQPDVIETKRTKADALKLTAFLARQWADLVDPPAEAPAARKRKR